MFEDESGDLGYGVSQYFVITILIVDSYKEYRRIEKSVLKMRKNKFKKELKQENEIKAYTSSKEIKLFMIDVINNLDLKSMSIFINKNKFKYKKLLNEKHNNEIYIDILKELIKKLNLEQAIILRLDSYLLRKYRKLLQKTINKELFHPNFSEIDHVSSEKFVGVQFADLIAWCILKNLENNNNYYVEKLNKNNHKIVEYKLK